MNRRGFFGALFAGMAAVLIKKTVAPVIVSHNSSRISYFDKDFRRRIVLRGRMEVTPQATIEDCRKKFNFTPSPGFKVVASHFDVDVHLREFHYMIIEDERVA